MTPPRILAIAGSDSSGGAGIQADIKTIAMLGGYAMTAITAITAQNTRGVQAAEAVAPGLVVEQIASAVADIGVDAIKIGMVPTAEAARRIAEALEALRAEGVAALVVLDPVLVATSGDALADEETIDALHARLLPLAMLATPNLPELAALTGQPVGSATQIAEAASSLARRHGIAVLAKGGHAAGDRIVDRLIEPDGAAWSFDHPRIETGAGHGTGCTLSSAIATLTGQGLPLREAIDRARQLVRLALHDAPGLGGGGGPLGHQALRLDHPPGPPGALALNQATLRVRDYDEAVAFWRALGLVLIVDSPANGYARFECANGATLSISVGRGGPRGAGGAALYFEVIGLEAARDALAERGIALDEVRDRSWNWREAWGADPSGNSFCLYEAREHRRWPPWRVEPDR